MNRQELYVQAQQRMLDRGLIGEAWGYVYQLASNTTTSRALLKTKLLQAANDPKIPSARRKVYLETADSLD